MRDRAINHRYQGVAEYSNHLERTIFFKINLLDYG